MNTTQTIRFYTGAIIILIIWGTLGWDMFAWLVGGAPSTISGVITDYASDITTGQSFLAGIFLGWMASHLFYWVVPPAYKLQRQQQTDK